MAAPASSRTRIIRFGTFELNAETGELRNKGARVKVEAQPLRVLEVLVERPGELVTREELKQRLWPADTFVDFDHSINVAIKRLREALNDSPTAPRFIETLPRRGYRFICPLAGEAEGRPEAWWRRHGTVAGMAAVILVLAGVLVGANVGGIRDRILFRPVPGEITSIAVLPLRDLGGDPEQDYFAAGMTEMLITELGRVAALRVPSHQTVLGYSKGSKPLPVIARELNVDTLIEGTVLRSGDRVRVTINLVQARPERHLWAEKYDRELRDIFLVQDEIAQNVLLRIRAQLTPDQRRHFSRSRPVAPAVNELYLKGRHHARRGTYEDRIKAYRYFQQAVQQDANFAAGYAELALMDAHGGIYRGPGGLRENLAKARKHALKALELDDTLAEAHTALAWLGVFEWNAEEAETHFRRAIELNPNYVLARMWYIPHLVDGRRFAEAEAQARLVVQMEPASPDVLTHAATYYLFSGRVDEAIELYRRSLELQPDYEPAHGLLGKAFLLKGMYREAVVELEQAAGRGEVHADGLLAYAYARAGRRADALRIVRDLEKTRRGGGVQRAFAYIGLGDHDGAFAALEDAYDRRGVYMHMLNADPVFEPLRSDPRFQDLVRRVGLPLVAD